MTSNIVLFLLLHLFHANMVATMDGGEYRKGKRKAVEGAIGPSGYEHNHEIETFRLNGRVEPPLDAGQPQYEVIIFSEPFDQVRGIPEIRLTNHLFSMPLHFQRKMLKKWRTLSWKLQATWHRCPSMREMLSPQWLWQNWRKCLKQEDDYLSRNDHGVKEIKVVVKKQLPNGNMAERSWTILQPDFSLEYQFHFGPVEGHTFSLKGKMALPYWFSEKLKPGDELAVVDMEETVEFGRLQYDQWLNTNQAIRVSKPFMGENWTLSYIYRFNIPLDAKKLGAFLAANLVNPQLKIIYSSDKMLETNFNAEEYAKEDTNAGHIKAKEIRQQQAAESSGHGNGNQQLKQQDPVPPRNVQEAKQTSALNSQCVICQNDYKDGEKIWRGRFCRHTNHPECVKKWLQYQNKCFCGKKLCGNYLALYLEGPVFSNDAYSFEYAFILPAKAEEAVAMENAVNEDRLADEHIQEHEVEHPIIDQLQKEEEEEDDEEEEEENVMEQQQHACEKDEKQHACEHSAYQQTKVISVEEFDPNFARQEHMQFMWFQINNNAYLHKSYVDQHEHVVDRIPLEQKKRFLAFANSRLNTLKLLSNGADVEKKVTNDEKKIVGEDSGKGTEKAAAEEERRRHGAEEEEDKAGHSQNNPGL